MAQPLPITFADLPVGLEPLSLFDQQFQASTDGAYLKDDSVPLSALLTGTSGLAVGVAAFLGTPSSENLAAALTDKTGTGIAVFSNSPTLVTPALGTPTAIDLTNATGLGAVGSGAGVLPSANGGVAYVTSIADMQALDHSKALFAQLNSGGRSGTFLLMVGDYSAQVAADTQHAVYVPLSSDPTGASYCYVRVYAGALDVRWFGAIGDGTTDDSIAIQSAFDLVGVLGGGGVRFTPGYNFRAANIDVSSNTSVIIDGVVTQAVDTGTGVFNCIGSLGAAKLLSSDASPADTGLTIPSGSGFSAGDWLVLSDTADYSTDPAAIGYKSGETAIVLSVSTGASDVITVSRPIYGSMLSGGKYTTANSSSLKKVTALKNISFLGSGRITLLQTSNSNGIYAEYVDGLLISEVKIDHFAGSAVLAQTCRNVIISGDNLSDGLDDVAAGFPGYGVCIGGASDDVIVSTNFMSAVRHGFTTVGGANGYPTRVHVSQNEVSACTNTAIDTHQAGRSIVISDNLIDGQLSTGAGGINFRTDETTIRDNRIRNVAGSAIGNPNVGIIGGNVNIVGNEIENAGTYGITVGNAFSNLSVTDNKLVQVGLSAINVSTSSASVDGLVINDNKVSDFGLTSSSQAGILISGSNGIDGQVLRNYIGRGAGISTKAISVTANLTGPVQGNIADGFTSNPWDFSGILDKSTNTMNNFRVGQPRNWTGTIASGTVVELSGIPASTNLIGLIGASSAGATLPNGMFRFRPNASPMCAAQTAFGANIVFTTGALTPGGGGGNFTISAANGALYLDNETGASMDIWLDILGRYD